MTEEKLYQLLYWNMEKNAEQINMDILRRWVQGKGISDRTWRGLLGVLRVHCPGLAEEIEETLRADTAVRSMGISGTSDTDGSSIASPPQQLSTLSCFNKKLRDWYTENPLPYYFNPRCYKWMPNVSKAYIHPDIISKEEQEEQPDSHKEAVLRGQRWRITEEGKNTDVQLEELLMVESDKKCKCVLVEGGPGMGKSTLAWQVCHRWGRRELFEQYSTVLFLPLRDERVQQAKHVEDFFFHLRNKKAQEEVKLNIGTGRDTIIILDGLDELSAHLLLEQSIFTDLLSGEVLGDATILVTSCPSATQQLLTYWKKRISKHFIICGFNERDIEEYTETILSGEKLTEFQSYLSIHPHLQSIMYVPLHSAIVMAVYLQHKELPKTRSQLYMELVETIVFQYLGDHPEYCREVKVSSAIMIGMELPKAVYAHFKELCRLASDTVCRQELIFSNKTMPKVLHDLGFTDSVPGLYMHRTCSYNFLHLSIQEFLAAYHVSLLSPQEQEQLLLRSREEHHLRNMMRFVAGLTKFEGIKKEVVQQVVVVNEKWHDDKCYLDNYGLELLYECQNMSVLDKEGTYSVDLSLWLNSHHSLALGYCIANSKCGWTLDFHYLNDKQMLVQGLKDCRTQPAYTIKYIQWNDFIDEVHGNLLTQGPDYFTTHIESMCISLPMAHFCQWLPTCHLKTLSLRNLQLDSIIMVSRALTAVPSLKILDMWGSQFSLQSMRAFASMLKHNQSVTEVDISNCNIDGEIACCLAGGLFSNTTLKVLNMRDNLIDTRIWSEARATGTDVMIKMLRENTILTVLNISKNSVGSVGAIEMATLLMLNFNTTLTVLNMSENSVGNEGAQAMATMLEYNTSLEELHMDGTIGVEGAKALVGSLAMNHHLKKLYISENYRREYKKAVAALPMYSANVERVIWKEYC